MSTKVALFALAEHTVEPSVFVFNGKAEKGKKRDI